MSILFFQKRYDIISSETSGVKKMEIETETATENETAKDDGTIQTKLYQFDGSQQTLSAFYLKCLTNT